jgi:hypothetical protein
MKKIVVLLLITLSFFVNVSITNSYTNLWENGNNCAWYDFDNQWDVWDALDKCLGNAELVKGDNVTIEWWFSNQIKRWTENISLYLGVLAVASILIWALMLTFSAWEEEKVKKAKDIVKWWIIWFLGVVVASTIITIIIKIIYSI